MKARLIRIVKACKLWGIYIAAFGARMKRRTTQPWVLARVACLGMDTYQLLNTRLPLYNIQKGRVDYLYRVNTGIPGVRARAKAIIPFIERDDIKELIMQEEFSDLLFQRPPEMLYMDSYSELTDQLFVSKKNAGSFCCNYSDLLGNFTNDFIAEGLLPENSLVTHYRNFFSLIRERFGAIDILFIHFPCKLDAREEFISRHHSIKEAIQMIHTEFLPFYIYEVPDEMVEHAANDRFPYHYGAVTYQYLQALINKNHFIS